MAKTKQWKNGGDEDKFIEKLISQGRVNKFTKPSSLKKTYPNTFGAFTPNVIRNHLNILKRNKGLYRKYTITYFSIIFRYLMRVFLISVDGDDSDDTNDENDSIKGETVNDQNVATAPKTPVVDNLVHQNYPILCETYKDPDNHCDKVAIAVSLPSGAQQVKTELDDNGMFAIIKYHWPKIMFDMNDLFKKQFATNQIHPHHPKLLSLKNGLQKNRTRIDMTPESIIKVNLPMKVQTHVTSWSKSGVKRDDGTQVLLADFTCYVKDYNKKSTDSTVVFE